MTTEGLPKFIAIEQESSSYFAQLAELVTTTSDGVGVYKIVAEKIRDGDARRLAAELNR